jgi:hypothetical protein
MEQNTQAEAPKMLLGDRLRQLTGQAKLGKEIEALTQILEQAAMRGENQVAFEDLRLILPLMIQGGQAYDWIRSQGINVAGQVNQDTAKHEMVLSW